MPVMDRFDLLKKLSKLKNKISVSVMTAKAESNETSKTLDLGAVDYLTKSCSPEDLISCVTKYIVI